MISIVKGGMVRSDTVSNPPPSTWSGAWEFVKLAEEGGLELCIGEGRVT